MTRHLDLGCGPVPRNPYGRDELHAIDIMAPEGADASRFRTANLSLQPIPHNDSSFDSVSAFDFIEHVPRVLSAPGGQDTLFPFIRLMDEIWRVLVPGGRFYALTPAFPSEAAFGDPTHVNVITEHTHRYFCGEQPLGRMYGFRGNFMALRVEWALLPEAFSATQALSWQRALRRFIRRQRGRLSHLVWELEAVKPATAAKA